MWMTGWLVAAICLGAAGVSSGQGLPEAPAERSVEQLIADLADDGIVGNMDRAVFALVQDDRPETNRALLAASRTSKDKQTVRAITAILWYHEDPSARARDVAIRTVEILEHSTCEGGQLDGTLYGQDCVAMKYLAMVLTDERGRPAKSRPVTDAVRRLATEGRGRPRLLAWALLPYAQAPGETARIVAFLRPHVRDNNVPRDAMLAAHALREIARYAPQALKPLKASSDPLERAAAEQALAARRAERGRDLWERLPTPDDAAIDALHSDAPAKPAARVNRPATG